MLMSLPIPSWNTLHPLVIHFPIALLLIAPLFVVLAVRGSRDKQRIFLWSALILLALGTASLYMAMGTGKAASKLVARTPEINATLEYHRTLAKEAAITFTVVTATFALILLISKFDIRASDLTLLLPLSCIVSYLIGVVLLVVAAHNGARLVHQLGVRSINAIR